MAARPSPDLTAWAVRALATCLAAGIPAAAIVCLKANGWG